MLIHGDSFLNYRTFMCASEVRFVPGSYVEADHVNGRPHSFYVKSLKASGVNQAFLHTNEALVPSPKRLANNVLFTNFDS